MNELDETLSLLAAAALRGDLSAMDDAVLAGLALRCSQIPASTIWLAAVAALVAGVVGAAVPGVRAEAASVTPFGALPALSSSTLLGNSE